MSLRLQAHPWHGIPIGDDAPVVVNAFIEIVPSDTVKYEIDKTSGHLKLDRPQQFSNVCPAPYGFVPQTWCKERVGTLAMQRTGRSGIVGDGDPLDVCVLTERPITHGAILVRARPIGGLRLLDRGEADDKVIAVLVDDPAYGGFRELGDVPPALVDRLRHYFLTYKDLPDPSARAPRRCEISEVYGVAAAHEVITTAMADYAAGFPVP
ncbi:MAG: inorganic pyrophosphatase [Candidatus Binatia bacterium]